MHVFVSPSTVEVRDTDDLRRLDVHLDGVDGTAATDAVRSARLGEVEGEHAWLDTGVLRASGSGTPEWLASFDGMLAFAAGRGWTSADGSRVRAHLVRVPSAAPSTTPVDPATFRAAMSRFASGIVVVTGIDPETGAPVGMTCQSFSSLSLDPPMVLFSAAVTSTSLPGLLRSGTVAVNVLAAEQHPLSDGFSRRGTDKFAGVPHERGPGGVPLLTAALAHVVGTVSATHPGGDHTIVLVDVGSVATAPTDGHPLVYYASRYRRLADLADQLEP